MCEGGGTEAERLTEIPLTDEKKVIYSMRVDAPDATSSDAGFDNYQLSVTSKAVTSVDSFPQGINANPNARLVVGDDPTDSEAEDVSQSVKDALAKAVEFSPGNGINCVQANNYGLGSGVCVQEKYGVVRFISDINPGGPDDPPIYLNYVMAAQAKLGTPPAGTKLKVKGNEAGGLDYRMYDDSLNG